MTPLGQRVWSRSKIHPGNRQHSPALAFIIWQISLKIIRPPADAAILRQTLANMIRQMPVVSGKCRQSQANAGSLRQLLAQTRPVNLHFTLANSGNFGESR